jgi:hypothetical protein
MLLLAALCTLKFVVGTSSTLLVDLHLNESWKLQRFNLIRKSLGVHWAMLSCRCYNLDLRALFK